MSGKRNAGITGCTKKEGAAWVSVKKLGLPDSIAGATVTLTGPGSSGAAVTKTTDHFGLVQFTGLKPGKYTYSVTLPGAKQNSLKLEGTSGALAVSRGEVALGGVEAYPIGTLNVRVVDDNIPPQVIANVSLSGAGGESVQRAYGAGTHGFAGVKAGSYNVSAVAGHMTRYSPREGTSAAVDVPEGGAGLATIVLQIANTVTPVIELVPAALPKQPNEAWFVKPDHTTQATAAGFVEVPLELRFKYTETNVAKPFTGGGTVSFDPAIKLFRDAAMTIPVPGNSLLLTHGELAGATSLYAKGASVGSAQVRLALEKPTVANGIVVAAAVDQPVVAKEVVMVEPKVELEYKVVVFDRDLAQHQTAAGEPPEELLRPTPTRIELALKRSAGAPPPYTGEGTLAAANCTAFTDAACTLPLGARKLTHLELSGGSAFKLYLRGTTRGLFNLTLTLDPSTDPRLFVALPVPEPMGVVEIQAQIFQHVTPVVVAADTYALTGYCADLEQANLIPDQVVMTDADKVRVGRLLHLQAKKAHGRAKVVVHLTAAEWPAGTDDYDVVLASDHVGLKSYDRDPDGTVAGHGTKVPLPLNTKVSALKLADQTVWIEGGAISSTIRSKKLSVGLDRAAGGLAKQPIEHADWGRFTVVKIDSVKLEYTEPAAGQPKPWNASKHRWYINYQAGDAGRTVKIRVRLSKPIAGIRIHFMLAPDKDNLKEKNWGIDLPTGANAWDWNAIDTDVKQKDKDLATHLLHKFEPTDAEGKADKDLVLSRFGGDRFVPAAYVDQDPHLAAYVHEHVTLKARKPALCDHQIIVWRRFAYQKIKVAGTSYPALKPAKDVFGRLRADMFKRKSIDISSADVKAMARPALYPAYMFKVNGGKKTVLNVSDANINQFFGNVAAETEHPIKVPIITCDFNWGEERVSKLSVVPGALDASTFPITVASNLLVCDPPLQGGNLLSDGEWVAAEPGPNGAGWVNVRNGNLAADDLSISSSRADRKHFVVALPAGVGATTPQTKVWITKLKVQGAKRSFLGGYNSGTKQIVAVYDASNAFDYQNTVVHELGHAFHQVPLVAPAPGVPLHPNTLPDPQDGDHCSHDTNKCVMFTFGPIVGSLNRFCPVCHPYMLVQDMESLS